MKPVNGVQLHALAAVALLAREGRATVTAAEVSVGVHTGQPAEAVANTLRSLVARELLTVTSGRRDEAGYALTSRGIQALAANQGSLQRTSAARGRKPRQAVAVAQFLETHPGRYWTIRQVAEHTGAGREAARQTLRSMVAAGQADIDSYYWPPGYRLHDEHDGRHAQEFTSGPDGLIHCASCQAVITGNIMLHEQDCTAITAKLVPARRLRRIP